MRARHRIAGLAAACTLAALGLGGAFGASGALAETANSPCSTEFETGTTPFKGEGSSLQKIAQEIWTGVKGGLGFNKSAEGCTGAGKETKVSYTADGSAAGLQAYGVEKKHTPAESKDAFVGSDDAPNGSFSTGQIGEIETAAKGTEADPEVLVIPVAQAPIAMIANPPKECKLVTKNRISNASLQKVWAGELTKWSELKFENTSGTEVAATEGTGCSANITRVVRFDGSGTTYQFKHYLFEINSGLLKKTKGTEPQRTWEELQPEETRNKEWPEESTVVRPAAKGGGEEVKKTYETEGSIGYANLADARAGITHSQFTWFAVQNQKAKGKYEWPGTTASEPSATAGEANCEGSVYPSAPTSPGTDDNWSAVYGGHPSSNEHYSICTLTWDVALGSYERAEFAGGGAAANKYGQAAYDYLKYVVAPKGGQTDFLGSDYGPVEKVVKTFAKEEAEKVAHLG